MSIHNKFFLFKIESINKEVIMIVRNNLLKRYFKTQSIKTLTKSQYLKAIN